MCDKLALLAGLLLFWVSSSASQLSGIAATNEVDQRCELEFGFRNESVLLGDSEFVAVFGRKIPNGAKSLAKMLDSRTQRWFQSELTGLLAASRFYSLTADLSKLNDLTKILEDHKVFGLLDNATTNEAGNWNVGLSWLSRDAYLAQHYLNIWLLTHDEGVLVASLDRIKALFDQIQRARANQLPNVFGPYWQDNQKEAADLVLQSHIARIAKTIAIARVVNPSLLDELGIRSKDANYAIKEFLIYAENLIDSQLEFMGTYMDDRLIFNDAYASPLDDGQSLSEPVVDIIDALFWKAIAKESPKDFDTKADQFATEHTSSASCVGMSLHALNTLKRIELETIVSSHLIDKPQVRRSLSEIQHTYSKLSNRLETNGGLGLLGYPRTLFVLHSLDQK